jgi:hypothetical protein
VCSEMIRIGKAGYVEVPSRLWETCRGHETGIAGLSHHRWLIDISGNQIRFLQKFHMIHNWQYSLPAATLKEMGEKEKFTWLFWEGSFEFSELTLHGPAQTEELTRFVNSRKYCCRHKRHCEPCTVCRTGRSGEHAVPWVWGSEESS